MKNLIVVCSVFAFIGVFTLPIGFYTMLRVIVTIGAVAVIVAEFKQEFSIEIIAFGIIAILFNPLIPIYLNNKEAWMAIDFIVGVVFAIKAFTYKSS